MALSPITGGPSVNEAWRRNIPGVFAAGNVLHVHDLVDYVSEEAGAAGEHAAAYILKNEHAAGRTLPVRCETVCATPCPRPSAPDCAGDTVTLAVPGGRRVQKQKIAVYLGDTCIFSRRMACAGPGEDGDCAAESRPAARRRRRRDRDFGGGLTMEKRELTCIGCPMGCALTVELDGGAVVSVRGNTCPAGDAYARKEVTAPPAS